MGEIPLVRSCPNRGYHCPDRLELSKQLPSGVWVGLYDYTTHGHTSSVQVIPFPKYGCSIFGGEIFPFINSRYADSFRQTIQEHPPIGVFTPYGELTLRGEGLWGSRLVEFRQLMEELGYPTQPIGYKEFVREHGLEV